MKRIGVGMMVGFYAAAIVGAVGHGGIGAVFAVIGMLYFLTFIIMCVSVLRAPGVGKPVPSGRIDDATGAVVDKVLDADWRKVRSMEKEAYGHCYHRLDGTTNELGFEPVEPEAEVKAEPGKADYSQAKCYCHYCKGRAGVHGDEARFLYVAQLDMLRAKADAGILTPEDLDGAGLAWKAGTLYGLTVEQISNMPVEEFHRLRKHAGL